MSAPKRILVIQLRRIGDVILTTPAVAAIKRAFPEAKVDFLVEAPADQVLRGNADINEILVYKKSAQPLWLWRIRAKRYDWVIDFMGNPRTGLLTALSGAEVKAGPKNVFWNCAYSFLMPLGSEPEYAATEKTKMLAALGVKYDARFALPKLAIPGECAKWAEDFMQTAGLAGTAPVVAFAPASRKLTRSYPPRHYAALAKMLAGRRNAKILLFWGPGEKRLIDEIARDAGANAIAAPQMPSLLHMGALLAKCRLLVSNCNGPKHIAVAVGTPTLTIHASSDPRAWTPSFSPKHRYIRKEDLSCIGCRRNECPRALECLEQLPPEDVYAGIASSGPL